MTVFQNCSSGGMAELEGSSSRAFAGANSPGDATLIYKNYGQCGAAVDVQTEIHVSADFKAAEMVVQNCVPVSDPVQVGDLDFAINDNTVFTYQNLVFDQVTATSQKRTIEFCGDASLDATVWVLASNTSALMGSVTLSPSKSTGALPLTSPSMGNYTSGVAVGGASMSLSTSGTVNYTINGTSQTDPNVTCISQPLP